MRIDYLFKKLNSLRIPKQFPRKNTQPFEFRNSESHSYYNINALKRQIYMQYGVIYAILWQLQVLYGLRWSDLKPCKRSDVDESGLLTIHTAKGNYKRLVYIPELESFYTRDPNLMSLELFPISYFQYYRFLKRIGYYNFLGGKRKKYTVTHLARHNRISRIASEEKLSLKELANWTGHKSQRSLSYYIHPVEELQKVTKYINVPK